MACLRSQQHIGSKGMGLRMVAFASRAPLWIGAVASILKKWKNQNLRNAGWFGETQKKKF